MDLEELAELTPNYSGAEIQGVVNCALSYAQVRVMNAQAALSGNVRVNEAAFRLTRNDFLKALTEVHAGYGRCDEGVLSNAQQLGFLEACGSARYLEDIRGYIDGIRQSTMKLGTVLLYSNGLQGTGKSALAAQIAKTCAIEFVKFVSAEDLVLKCATETDRCNRIVKAFQDAYKVPEALIILDSIEDIIMYTSEGMRFSNLILTTLVPLLKRGSGKVIVVGTTSKYYGLQALDVVKCFSKQIEVGGLDKGVINDVCAEWARDKGVEIAGDVASELQFQERESVAIRPLLQSLEQAAAGKKKISSCDVGKAFGNTW